MFVGILCAAWVAWDRVWDKLLPGEVYPPKDGSTMMRGRSQARRDEAGPSPVGNAATALGGAPFVPLGASVKCERGESCYVLTTEPRRVQR